MIFRKAALATLKNILKSNQERYAFTTEEWDALVLDIDGKVAQADTTFLPRRYSKNLENNSIQVKLYTNTIDEISANTLPASSISRYFMSCRFPFLALKIIIQELNQEMAGLGR